MENIQIDVTSKHIESGIPNSHTDCPIALCIKADNPEADVQVYGDYVTVDGKVFDVDNEEDRTAMQEFTSYFDSEDREYLPDELSLTFTRQGGYDDAYKSAKANGFV